MQSTDLLSAVRRLGVAMAHASDALGDEHYERLQRRALAEAVGGIAPLGLSAAQMAHIAERLEREAVSVGRVAA